MGYEAEPIEMAMLVLKTQTNLTNYGWHPSHSPQEKEHPLPEPQHHTQTNLEDFGFDFPQVKVNPPTIDKKEELLGHMENSAAELGLDGLEYWFNHTKLQHRRDGLGKQMPEETFKHALLNFKSEIYDAMQDLDTKKHPSLSDEDALIGYNQLLNQLKTLDDNPPDSFNFNTTPETVQTILGQYHPSLPGPYSDEPINMIRLVPKNLRTTSYTHPITGRRREQENFDTRPSILSGGMPVVSQTRSNKQFEVDRAVRGGKQRVFPLGDGGSFYVPNNMTDLSRIATDSDLSQSTLWGLRGLKPQQIDALMRGAHEAPEELNEILVREKIDPHRVVDLSTSASLGHRGKPTVSLSDVHHYRHMITNPLAQIMALRGPDGKPLVTSTGETIDERFRNIGNIKSEEHPDFDKSKIGVYRNILDEYKHLPKIHDILETNLGAQDWANKELKVGYVNKLRTLLDMAQEAGMSRFATSDVDIPMGENFWPLNPQGEKMSFEELEAAHGPIQTALSSLKNLHLSRRPPDWGEEGEEAVMQPPTTDEMARLYEIGAISDDYDSYSQNFDTPDNFHNFYSNVEAMDALRQMREEDASN